MKLVKYAPRGGQDSIGLLEGEEVLPLASTGGQYQSLTDILEADDPAALIELLFDQAGEEDMVAEA